VKAGALGPQGQVVWRVCRSLVFAATRGGFGGGGPPGEVANREIVARLLGTSVKTLEGMMAPSDVRNFRADQLMALMTAETIVPEEARHQAAFLLCAEWGGTFTPETDAQSRPQLSLSGLELAATTGRAAHLIREAQADGRVDELERAGIAAAVSDVRRAAGDVQRAAAGAVAGERRSR
jgi:hypothetical protein